MPHITEKELLMISDDLLEHETVIEKYGCYLREVQDPEIRSVIQRHQGILQQHYQELLNLTRQPGVQAGYQPGYQTGYQAGGYEGGYQPAHQSTCQTGFGPTGHQPGGYAGGLETGVGGAGGTGSWSTR